MRYNTYLNISEAEAKTLDALLHQIGFRSRTEYFTACAHVAVYGRFAEEKRNPDPLTTSWITALQRRRTETARMQETFFDILHEIAFPVIAMKGPAVVLPVLADDIRSAMLERCGAVPTSADMEEWSRIFENIFRPELISYRTDQYRNSIAEDGGTT